MKVRHLNLEAVFIPIRNRFVRCYSIPAAIRTASSTGAAQYPARCPLAANPNRS